MKKLIHVHSQAGHHLSSSSAGPSQAAVTARPGLRPGARAWALLLLITLLGACSPRHLIIQGVAEQLASQGSAAEDDLVLAREASGFYLKLSESVLRQTPGNLPLAEAVAGGFTQYAYAFVQFEADRLDATDAKAAEQLRQRAARLYRRALNHAMAALTAQNPGFPSALAGVNGLGSASNQGTNPEPVRLGHSADGPTLGPEQVGVAYWAAASWGALIALSKDQPEVVADLPQAQRLAQLAFAVAPEHGAGALASLMGSFEAARPGGSAVQAALYFDQAFALSNGKAAGPLVTKAESLALPAGDRPAFEALLQQALRVSAATPDLQNAVMRERAQWLLASADDLFFDR